MGKSGTLQPGERLGPYEIISFVAAGGMGEVYKARDPRLDRLVAIKRLTAQHSDRFQTEARAIAALNHPHICQVYDVWADYLVMEFLEGETLAQQLDGSINRRPLEPAVTLAIAVQIAEAVAAAHERGVLHRDLKPANIMVVRSGSGPATAKLLDFGLSRFASKEFDATRTVVGTVLGTAAYMSPEQADGRPLDARSDVFSFGAVIYELLSGHRPFGGTSTAQVLSAVLRDEPRPLQTALPVLDGIALRCLAKDPNRRFQTMTEVKAALEKIADERAAATRAETTPSIAVLPFADMSPNKDQEWFSDGLAEEIINALAHIPDLKVIARTSAFAFKGKNEDIRRIAAMLGVANILEGSVRRAGDRIRVTAQLIAASDGSHLWSERFDRELSDVFSIQDEIARAIAAALQPKLLVQPAAVRRYTPSLAAYEAFLKGRYHNFSNLTPESMARARECYELAIRLDPRFALPHVYLGTNFYTLAFMGIRPVHEVVPLYRDEVQTALELDPSLPDAHAALGLVAAGYDYDWREAEKRFQQAVARHPVPPLVRYVFALSYLLVFDLVTGIEQLNLALEDDPLSFQMRHVKAMFLLAAGRDTEALDEENKCLELNQNRHPSLVGQAWAYESLGMHVEALASAEKAHAAAPWDAIPTGYLAGLLAARGDGLRANELLETLPPLQEALGRFFFYCVSGDIHRAAGWAGRAIEQRAPGIVGNLVMPLAKPLRASAHWPALAKLMKLSSTSPWLI